MKKTKRFDCVEMKHQAQERTRRERANLSHAEELEYWQRIMDEEQRRREAKAAAPQKEAGAHKSQ